MITTPTVLVLGAGASMHLGYPSGRRLVDEITHELRDNAPMDMLANCLGLIRTEIANFREALRLSGCTSVDDFLEERTNFIKIGKAAIAQALIRYENPERLFPDRVRYPETPPNWFEYLFDKMKAEDRIALDRYPDDWKYYTLTFPVIRHQHLSHDDITAEMLACNRNFYTLPRILRRVWRCVS